MDFRAVRDQLKPYLSDYAGAHLRRSGNQYICPFCGSGTGQHHTGALSIDSSGQRWTCFACGNRGDIFDLAGQVEGISGAMDQLRYVADLYGVDISGSDRGTAGGHFQGAGAGKPMQQPMIKKRDPAVPVQAADYSVYYDQCRIQLENSKEAQAYLQGRGISMDTARKYGLGYDYNLKTRDAANNTVIWRAIIIPYRQDAYEARNIEDAGKDCRYRKRGNAAMWNVQALGSGEPVFLVEGVFDALSVMQAGGQALSLGSVSNCGKLLSVIRDGGQAVRGPVIIATDNDAAGQGDAVKKLLADLKALGVIALSAAPDCLYSGCKDANAALMQDASYFADNVAVYAENAREAAQRRAQEADDRQADRSADQTAESREAGVIGADPSPLPAEDPAQTVADEQDIKPADSGSDPADGSERQTGDPPGAGALTRPLEKPMGRAAVDMLLNVVQTERFRPIETGIQAIDNCLGGGLFRQTLTLLAAAPGQGKTTLASQIAEHMAKTGHKCLFLNYEMSSEQLLARAIARRVKDSLETAKTGGKVGNLSALDILKGYQWTDAQRMAVLAAAEEYKQDIGDNLIYNPGSGSNDLDMMMQDIRSAEKRIGKVDAVFIDYLQLLGSATQGRQDDSVQSIKKALQVMSSYAIDRDCCIFAITATNRASMIAGETDINSGRDTSNIEYSADVLLGLDYTAIEQGYKPADIRAAKAAYWDNPGGVKEKTDYAQLCQRLTLKVNKSRFSADGRRAYLFFDGNKGRFYPTDPPKRGSAEKPADKGKGGGGWQKLGGGSKTPFDS